MAPATYNRHTSERNGLRACRMEERSWPGFMQLLVRHMLLTLLEGCCQNMNGHGTCRYLGLSSLIRASVVAWSAMITHYSQEHQIIQSHTTTMGSRSRSRATMDPVPRSSCSWTVLRLAQRAMIWSSQITRSKTTSCSRAQAMVHRTSHKR
jgi:hypothetical protein